MSIQFFAPRGKEGAAPRLPLSYRQSVKWLPQIGDIFPDFSANTTEGKLRFWEWAEGNWVYLFSHPAARTPVCTTELGELGDMQDEFLRLGVKALGLTASPVAEQIEWHREIERTFDTRVWFPSAADEGGTLATLFGMQHAKESDQWPIRKSFIIDPTMHIRMMFEYPVSVGRDTNEILRVIEALQLRDRTGAATPANWMPGDPVIIPDERSEFEVVRTFRNYSRRVLPYLRIVNL